MTVRWKSGDFNGVPSGYGGTDVPDDIHIPPCGIEDVDKSLFNLFNEEIGYQVSVVADGKKTVKKVPVFFGVGEKWAVVKKNIKLRDKQGTLILPLISIRRVGIDQKPNEDQIGRGVNQATGEQVVKRRLGPADRDYQNLLNKFMIKNQSNLPESSTSSPIGSKRELGTEKAREDFLVPHLEMDVWEIITLPTQQFYTANYEITFWTQYVTHMNEMLQRTMSSFLPQLPCFKLTTAPGYWFIAFVNGDFKSTDNFDELVESERLVKYTFTIKVPAYIVAPADSGMPSPVRRFVSAPQISFDIAGEVAVPTGSGNRVNDPNSDGADDPTLGYSLNGNVTPRPQAERAEYVPQVVKNPFTKKDGIKFLKVVSVNARQGETVYSATNAGIETELE